ncbi:MAG: nucleotidyltransferase domain-containing protein [bacterium]|nr:nucleotidyltransferase domain-containing protein [bacterium]
MSSDSDTTRKSTSADRVPPAGWLADLLVTFKEGLQQLYGERLQGLYLFGSRARGETQADSDVDLAVVLDRVTDYGREIRRTSELTASLALEHEVSISCVFIPDADWRRAEGPFLVNVRSDAVAA